MTIPDLWSSLVVNPRDSILAMWQRWQLFPFHLHRLRMSHRHLTEGHQTPRNQTRGFSHRLSHQTPRNQTLLFSHRLCGETLPFSHRLSQRSPTRPEQTPSQPPVPCNHSLCQKCPTTPPIWRNPLFSWILVKGQRGNQPQLVSQIINLGDLRGSMAVLRGPCHHKMIRHKPSRRAIHPHQEKGWRYFLD